METEETLIFEDSGENVVDDERFEENVQVSFPNEEQSGSRKQFLDWSNICRVCANTNDHIIPIFDAEGAEHELSEKIHRYLPIRVSKTDTLPIQLCYHCAATILAWHDLLGGCLNAEKQLLQMESEQYSNEQAETKYIENLSEELVDDPEPTKIEKQDSSSTIQQEEEPEHCDIGEEAIKRSEEKYNENTDSMDMSVDDSEILIYVNEVENVFCEKCNYRFFQISELVEHMREIHNDHVHQCKYCETVFRGPAESFREHVLKHEREDNETSNVVNNENIEDSSKNSNDIEPEDDDSSLTTSREILETSDTSKFLDEKNDPTETSEETILIGRSFVNGDVAEYHCEICDLFMPISRIKFLRHIRHHRKYDEHRCDLCKETFSMEYQLLEHYTEAHFANSSSNNDLTNDNIVSVDTTKMTTGTTTTTTTKHHQTDETTKIKRSYMCEFCGKQYNTIANLRDHQRQIHAALKLHMCDLCERNYMSLSALENHRRTHTKQRMYTCEHCDKKFSTSISFYAHRHLHENCKTHDCTKCEKKFSTKQRLLEHLTSHEASNIPLVCETCGKSFAARKNLLRHSRVHNNDETFVCPYCPSKFRQKRYLRVHTQIHHPDE